MTALRISIKSFNKQPLKLYNSFLKTILDKSNIAFSCVNIPIKKKRITLLKSPHVHKKAREQFELRIYKTTFFIKNVKKLNNFNTILINKSKLINIHIKYIGK